uniref:Uncharacterized protein n=1 Tax=Oryza punctata TaxID=4537 RepID=A0A0E0LEM5_ORYPU
MAAGYVIHGAPPGQIGEHASTQPTTAFAAGVVAIAPWLVNQVATVDSPLHVQRIGIHLCPSREAPPATDPLASPSSTLLRLLPYAAVVHTSSIA